MARIKDTMLHPITEMKARKRKANPSAIDSTCPTQKRSRSASDNDIVIIDEDIGASHSTGVEEENEPGRQPSVELQTEESPRKNDLTKAVLRWSRLPMNRMRSALVKPLIEPQLTIFFRRTKDKYQILHFPLTSPLTDVEKSRRKVVTSLKV